MSLVECIQIICDSSYHHASQWIVDYGATFDTNNCTIGRNSHKIQGDSADLTVATERAGFTLVYVDSTQGWLLRDK